LDPITQEVTETPVKYQFAGYCVEECPGTKISKHDILVQQKLYWYLGTFFKYYLAIAIVDDLAKINIYNMGIRLKMIKL